MNFFHSIQNCQSGAPFWAPFFKYSKSMAFQLSLEKKINGIAILENFLTYSEHTTCKKWSLELRIAIFKFQKSKCPTTFLKISIRALHFWIKTWLFIGLIWFLIPHNIESVRTRIFRKCKKRSSKRSSCIISKSGVFQIWSKFCHFIATLTYM